MKFKMKGRQFDTVEEIQRKLQIVLDTLKKWDFQEVFCNHGRSARTPNSGGMIGQGDYFEGDDGLI